MERVAEVIRGQRKPSRWFGPIRRQIVHGGNFQPGSAGKAPAAGPGKQSWIVQGQHFASNKTLSIGVGGALGLIMLLNVWGIIWPNNKRAIGALQGGPPAAPELARQAFVTSRTNAWLSLPMLLLMAASHGDWLIFAGK